MIAIVTDFGDLDVAITFDEFDSWHEESSIQAELFGEGEVPCGKRIKIILEPRATEKISYRIDADDWDQASLVELICNQWARERLDRSGRVSAETRGIRIFIQVSNALGGYKTNKSPG